MTALRYPNAIVDSIDIDEGAIKQALFNIEHCPIPSVQNRIRLFHCPAQEFTSPPLDPALLNTNIPPKTTNEEGDEARDKQNNLNTFFKYSPSFDSVADPNGIYDLIICAPPYFKSDESTGIRFINFFYSITSTYIFSTTKYYLRQEW